LCHDLLRLSLCLQICFVTTQTILSSQSNSFFFLNAFLKRGLFANDLERFVNKSQAKLIVSHTRWLSVEAVIILFAYITIIVDRMEASVSHNIRRERTMQTDLSNQLVLSISSKSLLVLHIINLLRPSKLTLHNVIMHYV